MTTARAILTKYLTERLKPEIEWRAKKLDYDFHGTLYPYRTLVISGKTAWQAAAALIVEIERRLEPGDIVVMNYKSDEICVQKTGDTYEARIDFAICAERFRRDA